MPELLLGRFQTMAVEIREGGMSTVKKALDLQTGKFVAVKFLDISSSGELIGPMFRNEVDSLKSLKHANIAKFIASSEPTSDQLLIVTEWIEKRFNEAYLSSGTPNDPWEVLSNVGIPLASAIAHAHMVRNCEHRDIKPGNIMIRETGDPVLVDFNISKLYGATDNLEKTVREFQTPIYAPPHEAEPRRFTRDVYSLAVVLLEAIQGSAFTSFTQIAESTTNLPFELQSLFDKSTNQSSAKRIPNGTVMLQELEMLLAGYGQERSALKQRIHLYPQINAIRDLLDDQSIADNLDNRRKAESVLMDEIETDLYCEFLLTPEGYDFTRLRLVTKNRWLLIRLDDANTDKYFLSIYKAGEREEGELDSSRKRAMLIPRNLPFTVGQPKSVQLAFNGRSALIQTLTTWHDDKEEKLRNISDDKPEIFEQWSLLIDALDDLSTEGTLAATYSEYVVSDSFVDFTLDELPPTDFTGLAVEVLNNQGEPVFKGDVLSQASDVLRIRPAFKPKKLPKSGRIIPSIAGTRTSLARQRNAIDAISIMDESEPNLKSWLSNPEMIQVTSEVAEVQMISKDLDESKQIAVRSSLGNSPIHLIQGPPGTGKTEFIAEVVGQFLSRNPLARILIVSQTHVAVDNVLERLAIQGVEDMVRLAPKSNAGVDNSVLHLTLGTQMDSWVKKIRNQCKKNLELEVGKLGISLKDLETVYKLKEARSITLIIEHYKEIKKEVDKREKPTMSIEDPEFERSEEVDEKIDKVLKDLKVLIGEGINVNGKVKKLNLSELSTESIDAELAALTSGGEWSKELLTTMELQTEWLNRLTNDDSLTSYFLRTRKVVAGTCIGFIGHKALTDLEFDLCIVDEASKATSTEVLVPMSRAKKWILVGDDRQLPPLVEEELKKVDVREKYGLLDSTVNQTLFMYLESRMPKELKFQLNYQYRMVDEIGDLISECFYEGTLISQHRKRLEKIERLIPPILWLDTSKDGERRFETSSGTSQLNWHEANLVIRQLEVFSGASLRKVMDFSDIKILVMSAYQAQVRQISRMAKDSLGSLPGLNIDIKTIDQVQGRETDIAILSLTRSNSSRSMGFVNDYPRINVALSRAKHGLIIVGDRTMFEAKPNPLGRVPENIFLITQIPVRLGAPMIDDAAFLIEAFKHARPECKLVAIEDCGIPVTSLEVNLLTQRKREMAIVDEFVLRLLARGPMSRERVGSVLGLQPEFVIEILARLISDTVVVQERESKLLRISAFGRHVLDKDGDFFPTNHSEGIYFNRVTWEIEASPIVRAISRKAALESNWIVLPSVHKGKISDEDLTLEKIRNFFGLDSTKKIEILSLQSIRQKGSAKYVFGKLLAYQNHLTGKVEPLIAMDGILREDITSSLISQKIDMAALGFPDAEETLPLDKVQLEKYNEDVVSKDPVFDKIIEVAEKKTSQKKAPEALISAPVIRDVDTFEHVIYLQKALKNARSRILIISPWIKGNVVNDVFVTDLEDRIKKGVRVDIVYGYKNQLVRNSDEYRGSHKHALQKLYTLMKKYPQKMEIHELDDTHAKIMLFDDVVIKTSFNWLSFKGDPKRTYRFESGTYIEDPSHADDVYTQIVARLPDMKVPEPKIF